MNADIKVTTATTLPAMELMFADAQEHIENLLASDIYPRFVKHQMTTSAVKALSGDRGKYAGLGDCFCLTNPALVEPSGHSICGTRDCLTDISFVLQYSG